MLRQGLGLNRSSISEQVMIVQDQEVFGLQFDLKTTIGLLLLLEMVEKTAAEDKKRG